MIVTPGADDFGNDPVRDTRDFDVYLDRLELEMLHFQNKDDLRSLPS